MKNLFIILFSVLFSSTFCQNWNLINKDYEYHYAVNDEYNTTVKVDSFEVNTGDTTFFLNRIVTPCDSCIAAGSDEYLRYNQPTFLQRQVLKQGADFTFSDTLTFLIKSNENLSATWIFDAVNSLSAEIIEVNQETIFGILDSVKTILLTGNDTIKISKSFGITQFNLYKLIGLRNSFNNSGFELPSFNDYYNFQIGDVFQYRKNIASWANEIDDLETYKYTILDKEVGINYFKYVINKKTKNENLYYYSDPTYTEYIDTLFFIDSLFNLASSFKNELIKINNLGNIFYSKANFKYSIEGLKVKHFGNGFNSPLWTTFYTKVSGSNNLMKQSTITPDAYYEEVTEGLGLTLIEFNQFEAWGSTILIGQIKNGAQTGEVWEDWQFTGIKDLRKEANISVTPNPSSEFISINFELPEENIKVSILNHLGEIVFSKNYSNQKIIEIDVVDFIKGIYFLKLESEGAVYQQKLMIR